MSFCCNVIFLFQDVITIPNSITCHVSLMSSNLWQFLSLSLFVTLILWIVVIYYFEDSLSLGLSDVFAWIYALLGRTTQRWYVLLCASYQGIDDVSIYYWWSWPWSLTKVASAGFFHCKITVFPFVMNIGGEVLGNYANAMFCLNSCPLTTPWQWWNLILPCFNGNSFYSVSFVFYLFVQLLLHISINSWVFIWKL